MKTKKIYILFVLMFLSASTFAQQLFSDNQFLFNKFSLSPAYAGLTGHTEGFAGFKQNWLGVQGATEYKSLNINGAKNEKMGFGANVYADKTGIFAQFSAQLSYAYHLALDETMGLHFGLNAGLYNNRIDLASIHTSSVNDPVVLSYQDYHGTAFDAGFGISFHYDNLLVGFSLPRALGSQISYSSDYNLTYTLARHYQAHISYLYTQGNISVEPVVVLQMAQNTPLFYQIATTFNYKKAVWASLVYKKGNTFGVGAGTALSQRFVANYTYEFGNSGMYGISQGSHEIAIGFLLKYSDKKSKLSIFTDALELVEKSNDDGQIKRLEDEIKALKKEIKKIQEDLKKCCGENQEIKELREKLELLEIELKDQSSLQIEKIEYEKPFILENINFATNSDELLSNSYSRLNLLMDEMEKRPDSIIKIVGYTDDLGGDNYNLLLSKKRAVSVKNYLISQGVDANRIITFGMGKENPIAPNTTNEGRAKNRRIEVSFSAKK